MQFPLKLVFIINLLFPGIAIANDELKDLKLKLKSAPDSSQSNLLSNISKKYRNINLDSALFYSNSALQHAKIRNEGPNIIKANILVASNYSALGEFEKSFLHLQQAEKLALNEHDTLLLGEIYHRFGDYYTETSEYDKSIEYFNKSIEWCKLAKNKTTIASSLNGLGIIYWERGDLELALKKYLQAYKIADELSDVGLQMNLMQNMAVIYANEQQNNKAFENYRKILKLAIEKDNRKTQAAVHNNMAILYQREKKYTDALNYFEKSLEICKVLGDESGIALALNNIGENLFLTGNVAKAIDYLNKALTINRKLKLDTEIIYNLETLSKIYLNSGKLQEVDKLIEEGLQLCKRMKLKSMERNFLQLKSEYYYSVGNYKKAYKTFKSFDKLKDSLIDVNRSDKIAQLQTRFETENKEKENEILRVKNQFTQEKLTKEQAITNYLIVFFAITIALLVIVYLLYKSKTKINQRINKINGMLEESIQQLKVMNATKDKFFSIIAHDLRSPFNAILGFSELIKDEVKEGRNIDMIKEYNANINESAHSLFTLLENLLQWANSQRGELEFSPKQFNVSELVQANLDIFKLKAANKSINVTSSIEPGTIAYGDVNMINTIFRNLISNALKFTEKNGFVNISSELRDDFVFVKVTDSGVGISKENQEKLFRLDYNFTTYGTNDEIGSGLGLIICKEFVEKNGGSIWVKSDSNKGSEFIFSLKSAEKEKTKS